MRVQLLVMNNSRVIDDAILDIVGEFTPVNVTLAVERYFNLDLEFQQECDNVMQCKVTDCDTYTYTYIATLLDDPHTFY